ncbi:MAG TPA: NTP transferase domain-containing protein [Sphingomicrobium sp.]|nr:NTP transferase domain-containing protein [Sphingomicrobium sp.]
MEVTHKALIPVAGEPMMLRPLRTILGSDQISRIIVLTQDPADLEAIIPHDPRIDIRASQGTIAGTLEKLIIAKCVKFPILVTTADHALLDAQMLAEFIAKAAGADLALGVVERTALLARLPQTKRTWLPFRGGAYSGANLFAFGSIKSLSAIEQWRSVEQDRKKGWRVLAALGPALLLGAVLRLRSLDQSAETMGRKLGIIIRAVVLSNPLAGVDVDKPVDHALVEAILSGRA